MHQVYQAGSVLDAQLLCDRMIAENIDAMVRGALLSGAAGEIPVDSLVSVWVRESTDIDRARQIVADFELALRQPAYPRTCKNCGESTDSNFTHCWNCQAEMT